ncbi:MAG: ABC transporter substrate-binding protein [Chloroflexi bacterium]|nr:ABC transporter substrate-binding protein [Chloroflexota bacterium]
MPFLNLLLVTLLAACTSPTPTPTPMLTPTPTATPTPAAGPSPSVSPQPAKGSATLVAPGAPEHLDVHQSASEMLLSFGPGIAYSRLLRLKSGPEVEPPSLEVECDLCERWEHPAPTTYLFHLRPGVRWHDAPPLNGRELTAQDVVYSLERLRTPGWPGATLLQAVASVQATDTRTVEVTLRYPDADMLLGLAHGQSKIVAPEAVAQRGDLKSGPTIGTGPWVVEVSGAEGSRYRANPAYFEPGLPGLETLRITAASDASTRLALVLTGRADITVLDDNAWANLLGVSGAQVRRASFPQPGTGMLLGLKTDRPPFDRREVRQALFLSLDPWKALLTPGWEGRGGVEVGMPLAAPPWRLAPEEIGRYFNDTPKAIDLLALAQAQTPVEFTLSLADFGDKYLALGDAYAAMMRGAGLSPRLEPLNPRQYAQQVWSGRDFQAFLGPMPPVYSPNDFLLSMAHSQGRYAITGYADLDMDRRILEQSGADDGREELVRGVQRRMLEEAFLFMPASGASLWVWAERVRGFAPNFAASDYFHWAKIRVLP